MQSGRFEEGKLVERWGSSDELGFSHNSVYSPADPLGEFRELYKFWTRSPASASSDVGPSL